MKRLETHDKLKKVILFLIVFVLLVAFLLSINLFAVYKNTCGYNEAVKRYNKLAEEYENSKKQTCIDNIVGIPSSYGTLEIVDESFDACLQVVFSENNSIKIKNDTETVKNYCNEIESMLQVLKQITVPDAHWIEGKIREISDVTGTELVTEDNNPDGLLNQEGGYLGCIYFSLDEIEQTTVPGNTIVEKGTDCGGAIEIYASLAEAEARCEYLSGFDGTILYSGSYAIVGTMVIRTSYILSNEKQWEVTSEITKKLTEVSSE